VIEGQPKQLKLLFYHLLRNALQFRKTGEAAQVEVRLSDFAVNQFRKLTDHYAYADHHCIRISDKGKGFNPANRHRIFGLFTRFHNDSGRGLGLALCRKIIENHNGTIYSDSEEDAGTTITILLPMIKKETEKELLKKANDDGSL
jgi:phosphoserine phosphatase RsbU/P